MSAPTKVTIGRIVHVREHDACRPAIVTDVTEYPTGSGKFKVCLRVFHLARDEIRLGQDADQWHWPEREG